MQPDWNTPAGRALTALSTAIQKNGLILQQPIIVFGSAPLQICVDPGFLSADVDVCLPGQGAALKQLVEEIGMSKENASYYIEVVPDYIFRPSPNWRSRAMLVSQNGIGFLILLAKLRRLDEKDLRAFQLVLEKTGRPSEQELVRELQASNEIF